MGKNMNIVLCGVGGQGTILASKILATCLLEAGYDVKMSEIHGMSQRGGNVTTQVRFGDKVYSPILEDGTADVLVAFEKMEGLRYLENLRPEGVAVINDYRIPTATNLTGLEEYPEDSVARIQEKVDTCVINASEVAKELGNTKVMNIVLLGALVRKMGLLELDWPAAITSCVKPAFVEINLKAFQTGADAATA